MSETKKLSIDNAYEEIKQLERRLDDVLHIFATFEVGINCELKKALSAQQRAEIFARRDAYEQTLGVEAILARLVKLKEEVKKEG